MLDQFSNLGAQANFYVLVVAIMIGLGGSLHCVGMCGPLVTAAAQSKSQLFLYQIGRLLGYLFLGALSGLAGQHFLVSYGPTLNTVFSIFLGAFFILLGIRFFMKKPLHFNLPPSFQRLWQRFIPSAKVPNARSFVIGLFSIFLPCGFLYGVVLACVSFKSTLLGVLAMGAFWLGTVPAMTFAPLIIQKLLKPISLRHPYIAGFFFTLLGLITILWRYQYSQTNCPFCH